MDKPKLLIIEDDKVARAQIRRALDGEYEFVVGEDREGVLGLVATVQPHVIILGLSAPPVRSGDGLRLLREILDLDPLMHVIVLVDIEKYSTAVEALETGAFDYCLKPVDSGELATLVDRAVRLRGINDGNPGSKPALRGIVGDGAFPEMLGSSRQMLSIFSSIDRAARSDVTVLITGESGTGKELAARAIHAKSTRRSAAFVPLNCGGIPETHMEGELFGREKGEGTGGTVFLDKINELSPALQVKLLRFLQKREVDSLNIRIIAASNTDLKKATANGSFREDLYYLLAVVVIPMPPLRERGEDSVLLARFFLERMSREMGGQPRRFDQTAEDAIRSYDWPGNVRELENKVKRAIIMGRSRIIIPIELDLPSPSVDVRVTSLREAREEAERRTITAALKRNRGNISRTAAEIGVSRPTLHALVGKYNLQPAVFRE